MSDMHLGEHDPATAQVFFKALEDALKHQVNAPYDRKPGKEVGPAYSHIFLLGDLFDIWVGDDDLPHAYSEALASLLRQAERAGSQIFVMHGNRDFLLGKAPIGQPSWLGASGARFLPDPCVIEAFGNRIVLTHGDLLCTEDKDYQNYRKVVRAEAWQLDCLTKPLSERQRLAESIRSKSTVDKEDKLAEWMDAKEDAVFAMCNAAQAETMIHGHTHRPALHQHHKGAQFVKRYVLPDWSAAHGADKPQRGYFLVLDEKGLHSLQATQPS